MKQFLKPTKFIIIIYALFLIDSIHVLIGNLIDICIDPISFCAISSIEIVYIVISFILIPVKLFSWPFSFVMTIFNPVASFVISVFIYYIFASLFAFLFNNKRKIFYILIILLPIIAIIGFIIDNKPNNNQSQNVVFGNLETEKQVINSIKNKSNGTENIDNSDVFPKKEGVPNSWQTYRSEKFGFEFKYPNEFSIRQDKYAKEVLNKEIIYKKDSGNLIVVVKDEIFDITQVKNYRGSRIYEDSIEKIMVDNRKAYKYNYGYRDYDWTIVDIPVGNILITLRFEDMINVPDKIIDYLTIILNSFKFF